MRHAKPLRVGSPNLAFSGATGRSGGCRPKIYADGLVLPLRALRKYGRPPRRMRMSMAQRLTFSRGLIPACLALAPALLTGALLMGAIAGSAATASAQESVVVLGLTSLE